MRSAARSIVATLLVMAPMGVAPASAQTVEGVVEGADSRVLVHLVGEDGLGRAVQVTDQAGKFLLAAPSPGVYRLRVERVGFRPYESDPVTVEAGGRLQLTLSLPAQPLDLASAPVGPSRCVPGPGDGDRLALAWSAVTTAMEMALWNEERGELLLDAEVHRRQLEADARTVVRAEVPETRTGVTRLGPSVNPADLIARGFIREDEEGSVVYFPPAPAVLAHEDFLSTHCLRFQGPAEGALLGVAFEPREAGGGQRPPDVAG